MKKKTIVLTLIVTVILIFLAACGYEKTKATEPDEVYWAYWEACSDKKQAEAEQYLTEDAKIKGQNFGMCGFTHDAINVFENNQGNPPREFSEDPELTISDDKATMVWVDDSGNLAVVFLSLTNGEWKIANSQWSN